MSAHALAQAAIIELCNERGVTYIDTVTEPWEGGYTDTSLSVAQRSNYAQREVVLELKRTLAATHPERRTTAVTVLAAPLRVAVTVRFICLNTLAMAQALGLVVLPRRQCAISWFFGGKRVEHTLSCVLSQVHGANPGLVSHFIKQALLNIARDVGVAASADFVEPTSQLEWATLASTLGVQVIHIAERDTQVPSVPKRRDEFVNTWSIDGLVSGGCAVLCVGTRARMTCA